MTKTPDRKRQEMLWRASSDREEYARLSQQFRREDREEQEERHVSDTPRPDPPKPAPEPAPTQREPTPRERYASDPRYAPKPIPKPAPKAVGLLVRVSTEDQRKGGYSVDDQITWGRQMAARLRLELIVYKEDQAEHSDMLDRPRLNALEEDIVAGKVGVLLLRWQDRLGRGVTFSKLIEFFKAWKVRIIVGDQPDVGDASDLLMDMYMSQGKQFLKTLRSRTSEGVRHAQATGKHVGGNLLGFKWEGGRWVPEQWALNPGSPEQMALRLWQRQRVRQAVAAYREGAEAFAALLNERRTSSRDRHMAARKRQEQRNNDREVWLTQHRPTVIERIAL